MWRCSSAAPDAVTGRRPAARQEPDECRAGQGEPAGREETQQGGARHYARVQYGGGWAPACRDGGGYLVRVLVNVRVSVAPRFDRAAGGRRVSAVEGLVVPGGGPTSTRQTCCGACTS